MTVRGRRRGAGALAVLPAAAAAVVAAAVVAGGVLAVPAAWASGAATTTSVVVLSGSPVAYGGDITLTVQVTSGGAPVPSSAGTVRFADGDGGFAAPCAAAPIDAAGEASCTSGAIDATPGSSDPVQASFVPASGGWLASSIPPLAVPVVTAPTITSLSSSPVSVGGDESLVATVEAETGVPVPDGSTVSFSDQAGVLGDSCTDVPVESAHASCKAGPFPHAGADTVSAVFNGSADLAPSPATGVQLDVSPAATAIALAPAAGAVGSTAVITATVSPVPDGGDVSFSDTAGLVSCDSAVDATGRATCTSAVLGATGSDRVTAQFLGNTDYSASAEAAGTLTVGPGATTVALQASPASPVVGAAASLTVTVDGPAGTGAVAGGTVAFSDSAGAISDCGAVPVAAATASCTTLAFAHAGTDTVSVSYSGSGIDAASGPWTFPLQVQPEQPTITATASPADPGYGQRVVLTATVSPPPDGGTVAFSDQLGDVTGCQKVAVSGGVASCTSQPLSSVGSDPITYSYGGNADYFAAGPNTLNLHVSPSPSQLSLSFDPSPATAGTTFTVLATVTPEPAAGSTATVSFSDVDGALAACGAVPVVRGAAQCTGGDLPAAGSDAVHASFSGDADLGATSAQSSLAVDHAATALALTATAHDLAVGTAGTTLTATVSPPPPAGPPPAGGDLVGFSVGGVDLPGCGALAVSHADPSVTCSAGPFDSLGALAVTASFTGDAVDAPASTPLDLQVVPVSTASALEVLGTPLRYGVAAQLVASVQPAPDGGTVAFADADGAVSGCGAVPLVGGQATCRIGSIAVSGPDTFSAAFSGTADFLASAASAIAAIDRPPALTTGAVTVTTGESAQLALGATGYPVPSFSSQSPLPAGLSLSAGGVLSGVPGDGEGGVYPVTVQLTGGTTTTSATLQLVVDQAPVLDGPSRATLTIGSPADIVIAAAPGAYPPPQFSETGTLPPGVSFGPGPGGGAVVAGTPAQGSGGAYTISVAAGNAAGSAEPLTIGLRVEPPPQPGAAAPAPIAVTAPAPVPAPRTSPPSPPSPPALAEVVARARAESLPAPPRRLGLGRSPGRLPGELDLASGTGARNPRRDRRPSPVALGPLVGFPSLGNAGAFGDCAVVAVSSVVRADHDAGRFGAVPPMTTGQAVVTWHSLNGGTGAGVTDAELLRAWTSRRGVLGTRLVAWRRLDVTDRTQLERAVLSTGALYAVLVVPAQASSLVASDVWSRPTAAAAQLGGHAVAVVGWTRRGLLAVTWGRLVLVTWSWWSAHAAAAFALRLLPVAAPRGERGRSRRS